MDNLLPTLAGIDVTSNQFRETSLPYQQWEAERTHNTPTTPSDVGHLLPPIGRREPRRESSSNPLPVPPHVGPSLPLPAPVDRNILDLYDPGLDPSPIGKEERGPVQPARISRIVPRRESLSRGEDSRGGTRPGKGFADDTVVTVLNGYRVEHLDDFTGEGGVGWASATASDEEENCIDIFVEGFSRGIEHATLLPSEVYCRTLQNRSRGPPNPSSISSGEEGPQQPLDAREGYVGLTILLARTGEWFDTAADVGGDVQGSHKKHRVESDNNILAPEATATRMIFTREDGTPGPSRNSFRVQFEPGPLGIELEEHAGQRGIVQVRRVLQAGQAELDGRLSPECLVVAVGEWVESDMSTLPLPTHSDDPPAGAASVNGADVYDSLDVSGLRSSAKSGGSNARRIHKPAMIHSLAELQEAVSSRQPDQLFTVWALDRRAPEAIAVLGSPGSEKMVEPPPGNGRNNAFDPMGTSFLRTTALDGCTKSSAVPEGAPGWESASAFARGQDSLEYSLSTTDPGVIAHDNRLAMARSSPQAGGARQSGGDLSLSALGSPKGIERSAASSPSEEKNTLGWTSRRGEQSNGNILEKGGAGGTGGWEFETGGGIFDEDDQGLAARKHPSGSKAAGAAAAVSPVRDTEKEESPALPMGLNASAVDEFAVFIWFCNNHESSVMNVSWIDYDGKLVPRRSLVPGACYFERSFATHPWVIHHDDRNNQRGHDEILPPEEQQRHTSRSGGLTDSSQQQGQQQHYHHHHHHHHHHQEFHSLDDDNAGECCLVRLGDAMALSRLTGSLIWNPTGRTLSITKQAKVGVPGMSATTHASVGSDATDGAGLDPGMKRLCMAGPRREDEEALARARRATVRKEKGRILQEMKAWRTHPIGAVGGGGVRTAGGVSAEGDKARGLGQGVPNLRVVMIGSSGCHEN